METVNGYTSMDYTAKYITPDIKLSCYEDKFFKSDIMFEHHMLIWFISGETRLCRRKELMFSKQGTVS